MSASTRILFVDDDALLLKFLVWGFRDKYEITIAKSGREALELVKREPPFSVIVSDMRMPGMDGVELFQEVKLLSPDTTRIMLTGQEDQLTAVEALNSGSVFRFLTKPCTEEALASVVEAAVRQYDLLTSNRVFLEQTLSGSVQVLVDLLSVFDPKAFGQAQQVREYALQIAARMGLPAQWDLGLAALLAPVGRMAIPISIQSKVNWGERLTAAEADVFRRVPETGARIVGNIPRLQPVARIIRYAGKDFDGGGCPEEALAGEDIPLESRILHVLGDFMDALQLRRSKTVVLEQLRLAEGKYDPNVLAALSQILEEPAPATDSEATPRLLPVGELEPGMCLVEDLCTPDGALVLAAGTRLAQIHLERLRSVALLSHLVDEVMVDG